MDSITVVTFLSGCSLLFVLSTIAGISLANLEASTLHQINVLRKSQLVGSLLYIAYYSDFSWY